MTVEGLIEILKKFDQKAEVLTFSIMRGNRIAPVKEISKYQNMGVLITADDIPAEQI